MVTITPVLIEEALTKPAVKEPSERTIRTRQLEKDAEGVVAAVDKLGAAIIKVSGEDLPAAHYLLGLKSALKRKGTTTILLQKRRGQDEIAAWKERPEDQERLVKRRETGQRLGRMAKKRASKSRGGQRRRAR